MEVIPFSVSNYTLENYLFKITSRSKIIYGIVIGIVISGIALLPFIYVDVSVQARGFFQSDIEKQVVVIPFQGRIVFSSIRNGDKVKKGDTLLIIDSETIRAQQNSLQLRMAENHASISDLEKLTILDSSGFLVIHERLNTKRYIAEFENLQTQQAIQFQKYMKKKVEHERTEFLFNQDIVPKSEYENSLYILNSERDNMNQIMLYQKSLWQSDLTNRRNEAVALFADYEKCKEELSNRVVRAPISGEIIQSSDIQSGSMVNTGQQVAEISPEGELVATCFIKPSDIGLINETQQVRIQVDAYNYNEWGMLDAGIIDISDDMIIENGSTAYFRIKCRPEHTFLSLKNGYTASVKKGMSLNARIVVTRRSLFNLLFDKADKWFNPYVYTKG
jgi:membrane fusion protein, peptide pheromone/bacteriocin exporter